MSKLRDQLISTLTKLKGMPNTDKTMIDIGFQQLNKTDTYTRDENAYEHFCVFTVPIVPSKRLIYMGHHIKANDWIPPGGHIDPGENPMQTVKREFDEELKYKITFEVVELFDFSVHNVEKAGRDCKIHLDVWYLVHLASPEDFLYDTGEFHDAGWMSYEEAAEKAMDMIKPIIEKIRDSK